MSRITTNAALSSFGAGGSANVRHSDHATPRGPQRALGHGSLIGKVVAEKYEIRAILGVGGMGVVCEARHVELGKRVALKLIDKSMKESATIAERFRREARAAGRIDSDHIVEVFDVGFDTSIGLFIVMEHLEGDDLATRLEQGPMGSDVVALVAHQIARGLAKAHAAGVVHRDLKPANVFLARRENGQVAVKILDFGVSRLLHDDRGRAAARITGAGMPIGTPLYMAPEQAEGLPDIDGRADIWSFGAVLYEALSGNPPFPDCGSYQSTIVHMLATTAKPLASVAPHVPPALAALVDSMLVHDRDKRVPDAAAVTAALLRACPSVSPDGHGRGLAVIVPSSPDAVDETGDTEVFDRDAMAMALSLSDAPLPRRSGMRLSTPRTPAAQDDSAPSLFASVVVPSEVTQRIAPVGPKALLEASFGTTLRLPPSHASSALRSPANVAPARGSDEAQAATEPQADRQRTTLRERSRVALGLALAIAFVAVAAAAYVAGRKSGRGSHHLEMWLHGPTATTPAATPGAMSEGGASAPRG